MKQALVIVAKAPRAGLVKTRLIPKIGPRRAANLYTCFLQDAIMKANSLPWVELVVIYNPWPGARRKLESMMPIGSYLLPQQGEGLADIFTFAFRHLLKEGYNRVVLINSDSPALLVDHIQEAFQELEAADIVLGPSSDGGYNLIGMTKPHVQVFECITWSTDAVMRETCDQVTRLGLRLHLLPYCYDVDTPADLDRLTLDILTNRNHPAVNTRRKILTWLHSGILRRPSTIVVCRVEEQLL